MRRLRKIGAHRGPFVVVAMLLLLGQVANAGHEVTHVAEDANDSCSICLHLDRFEHPVAETPDLGLLGTTEVHPLGCGHSLFTRSTARGYHTRAPPTP